MFNFLNFHSHYHYSFLSFWIHFCFLQLFFFSLFSKLRSHHLQHNEIK